MTTTPGSDQSGRATPEWIAANVYRLADASVRFRSLVERHYIGEEHEHRDTKWPWSPPPREIADWLSDIRAPAEAVAQAMPGPPAGALHGLIQAAEKMRKAFTDAWNTPEHRESIAPLRSPVGLLQFNQEGDYQGYYKPGELYHRVLSGPVIGSERWAEYEAQVSRLGAALRPPYSDLFALGRTLAAVLYPTCGAYDPETDSFYVFSPADAPGVTRHRAATERPVVRSRDLRAYFLESVGPRVAELLSEIQGMSGLLQGVEHPLVDAGRMEKPWVADFHDEIRRQLVAAAARVCRTGAVESRKQVRLSAAERERFFSIREQLDTKGEVVGLSDAVLTMFREIYECCVARHRTVLLVGPSGTGKSTVARFLHTGRTLANGPAPAAPAASRKRRRQKAAPTSDPTPGEPDLTEYCRWQAGRSQTADSAGPMSEWLGFAPTSGYRGIPDEGQNGLLKQYEGGTIFVDEFARLSHDMQVQLLDFAEGQTVRPIGAKGVQFRPNVYLIFATNEDITKSVRDDLRYRIKATIRIPPLAERIEDVFPLAQHFLKGTNYCLGTKTWLLFLRYSWPGNIRELQNVVEATVARMRVSDPESYLPPSPPSPPSPPGPPPLAPPPPSATTTPPPKTKRVNKPKKVPLPFVLFANHDSLKKVANEIAPVEESDAFREVFSLLEKVLQAQGYERGKRNQPLDARIAGLFGIAPSDLSDLKKSFLKQTVEAIPDSEEATASPGPNS